MRKIWAVPNQKSFLSKSSCLEQLIGIQTADPCDCMVRDTIHMGEPVGLCGKEGELAVLLIYIHEEIPRAEDTPRSKTESRREWLKPFE